MIVDKPKKYDAILSLHPDAQFVLDKDHLMWHSANIPQPSDDAIATELARLEAEHVATQYQRDRAKAYAPIADQLDMRYWDLVNGTTTWADHIAAVKAAHPKP